MFCNSCIIVVTLNRKVSRQSGVHVDDHGIITLNNHLHQCRPYFFRAIQLLVGRFSLLHVSVLHISNTDLVENDDEMTRLIRYHKQQKYT